ncbi:MAG: NAD-dependent epimerase/dehydratase family protein [Deltaproteobacteria bacterium]|nr:NAD-dependent epimerase/dehydratase family protein [Deltaproteobacteria bacterium]MCB9787090.1 NAD-dependent epimerase/dehydratase family protein [Deltaproteobacteria bacterium]
MSTASVVTGAGGFVGGRLVDALLARGDAVVATDVRLDGLPAGAQARRCDVTDPAQVRDAVAGAEVVFHVASLVHTRQSSADTVWAVNHRGTQNVISACRDAGVRRLVHVSSASVVYQGGDIEGGDESLPYATTSQAPYADSKIAAERDVLAAHAPDGLRTVALRPHVVYGPGDGRFLPAILRRAEAGRLKLGVGRGRKLSDFTYIDNLTDALLAADARLAADASVGARAYFITNGEPIGFWEFVDRVLVELGERPTRGRVPYWLAWTVAALAETAAAARGTAPGVEDGLSRFAVRYMCTHHYFSIAGAAEALGWAPRVSLDEGIRRTVAHLRDTGAWERGGSR